jgi:Zn-dependent peptidase ImmA (M78 family)
MINTYSPWGELAAKPHLDFAWADLGAKLGEYVHADRLIRLNSRLRRHQARSVLCHELRHAEVGDHLTACERVNLRQEQRADREAARLLVDVRDLGEAIAEHGEHHGALAHALRVSVHVVRTRLAHLHPSELHYLRRRLADS